MAINSKAKGKRGELEAAKVLRGLGFEEVRRTAQYNGKETGSLADLVGIKGVHLEIKRCENIQLYKWWEQGVRDAKEGEDVVLMIRKNGKPWLMVSDPKAWAIREHIYQKEWNE